MCKNPFYQGDWRSEEYLPVGKYGNSGIKRDINILIWLTIIGAILALLINHFWHNKDYEIPVTKEDD